jgi:hypothetical protein
MFLSFSVSCYILAVYKFIAIVMPENLAFCTSKGHILALHMGLCPFKVGHPLTIYGTLMANTCNESLEATGNRIKRRN